MEYMGLINWEWELSDDFMAMGTQWYEEIILMYTPFMRMKVQISNTIHSPH